MAGSPTTHYLVTYTCLVNGTSAVLKEKKTLTVPATDTSVLISDVDLSSGSSHVVIVTAVSGDRSASDMQYFLICKHKFLCYCQLTLLAHIISSTCGTTRTNCAVELRHFSTFEMEF